MTGGITSPGAGWRQADRGPATQRSTGRKRRRGRGRGGSQPGLEFLDPPVEFRPLPLLLRLGQHPRLFKGQGSLVSEGL